MLLLQLGKQAGVELSSAHAHSLLVGVPTPDGKVNDEEDDVEEIVCEDESKANPTEEVVEINLLLSDCIEICVDRSHIDVEVKVNSKDQE